MKPIKIIFSIAAVAFTSLCFGQLFSENNNDELYYTAFYDISKKRMEHHVDPFPARTGTGDYFNFPALSRTYFVPIEYDIPVEAWMTAPFETDFYEGEVEIEAWMEAPFDSDFYYEEFQEVEAWMTRPFTLNGQIELVNEEEIEVEAWMSKPWV